MSTLRVDTITDEEGTGAPNFPNGVEVNGGTINGTTIGATTPSSGAFTSITGTAVTQSETDTTTGRLMKVGDFGLGSATGILLTDADDLNDIRQAGFYYWAGTSVPANAPTSGNWFTLIVLPSGADNSEDTTQLVFRVGGAITTNSISFVRCYGGGSWQAWLRNYVGSNILGAVSQSGGVPTGAIIERGSNANGQFVRYADGTAEAILRGLEDRSASGAVTTVVTLPMSFIDAAVSGNTTGGSARYFAVGSIVTSVPATASSISVNNLNATNLEVRIVRSNSTNSVFVVYVSGRWF